MSSLHTAQTANHRIESWVYADETARLAAMGFTTGDVSKIAFQVDTGVYYRLTDDSPITWQQVSVYPYKKYVALLNQSSTDAPVATVLENTLGGTVVWTRGTVGIYAATLTGAFVENKTVIFTSSVSSNQTFGLITVTWNNANSIDLTTRDCSIGDSEEDYADGQLIKTCIEIRVYP